MDIKEFIKFHQRKIGFVLCFLILIFGMPLKALETCFFPLSLPQVMHSEYIYDGFIKLRQDRLCYRDGHEHNYYYLETNSQAVVILAITNEGQFVLNREYRHAAGAILLSCPGGCIDIGESPLEAAKRELLEETGYTAEEFTILGCCHPYPGLSAQKIYHVVARAARKIGLPDRDAEEIQETILMTKYELKQSMLEGHQIDGIMGTALFYYNLETFSELNQAS